MGKRKSKSGRDDWFGGTAGPGLGGSLGGFSKCADTHPDLTLTGKDGKTYVIRGGSCTNPHTSPDDYDVFVGFDSGIVRSKTQYPWVKGDHFLFHITDMSVPSNKKDFDKLIEYLTASMLAEKKVFIGCIGGHGRTGLVLAVLVNLITGEEDAITYVRKHYCEKAVESDTQVQWLNKHYGIKVVEASKGFSSGRGFTSGWSDPFSRPGKDLGGGYTSPALFPTTDSRLSSASTPTTLYRSMKPTYHLMDMV